MFAERTSKYLVDSLLTDAGVKKIEEIWPLARELDFEVIMVSPLRRAIQTAFHVFKVNPNFKNLKFILAPLSRESMLGCADVPLPI